MSAKRASKVKPRMAKDTSNAKPSKVMVYTCKRCIRKTRIPIGQLPKHKLTAVLRVEKKPEANVAVLASSFQKAHDDVGKLAVVNDSAVVPNQTQVSTKSKQRAKMKKQSGLQALLAKNKANTSAAASPAFDLMDFMKTS